MLLFENVATKLKKKLYETDTDVNVFIRLLDLMAFWYIEFHNIQGRHKVFKSTSANTGALFLKITVCISVQIFYYGCPLQNHSFYHF